MRQKAKPESEGGGRSRLPAGCAPCRGSWKGTVGVWRNVAVSSVALPLRPESFSNSKLFREIPRAENTFTSPSSASGLRRCLPCPNTIVAAMSRRACSNSPLGECVTVQPITCVSPCVYISSAPRAGNIAFEEYREIAFAFPRARDGPRDR
jgi:hypothetical protein